MSTFLERLRALNPEDDGGRRWLFVPIDQLSDAIGPLAAEAPESLAVLLVETTWKPRRRPYHRQKLALVLTNQRHFALEQAERGVHVRYVFSDESYGDVVGAAADEVGTLRVARPAERELRADLAPLVEDGRVEVVPHEGWLTSTDEFVESQGETPPWRMDRFYRHVRRVTGLLMEDGEFAGGKLSFDASNREPWRGDPPAPDVPTFAPDPITEEVCALVEERFADHPGTLREDALPATPDDARTLWRWAKRRCLPWFGPYQDAMSMESSSLFHSRISPLLHLHRLLPRDVVEEAAALDVPIESREGFVRQILGWREFVRHVHEATDGFRAIPDETGPPPPVGPLDDGASPSFLGAEEPLPPVFWGDAPSGLLCLDHVVDDVWRDGASHHITRLMVLSNVATLLDVEPRALADWFWVAYTDAYDWVVEPNVLGMGTFGTGDLMTTKPYVSGSAYIDRMGDACGDCAFDPKADCPIRSLYWAFLDRHRDALEENPRLRLPMRNLAKRADERREEDRRVFETVREALAAGEELTPSGLEERLDGDDA
ncbi:MAG: cryptochrome/photolyase family protein [Planctomycetota bacterium JB042]